MLRKCFVFITFFLAAEINHDEAAIGFSKKKFAKTQTQSPIFVSIIERK